MRRLTLLTATALIVPFLAVAAPAARAEGEDGAIQGVISRQIEAFLKDDFATAFTFASPMIQGIFGTSDNFGTMVREGYPMVWRPSDVRYGELSERDGRYFQTVILRDGQGNTHYLEYEMIEQDGTFRINGVRPARPPSTGA
jgi:hypothetical protein